MRILAVGLDRPPLGRVARPYSMKIRKTPGHSVPGKSNWTSLMKYSVDKQEKYAVFQIQEKNLNSLAAPELKSQFVILYNEGVTNLILDLSPVEFVDSSGLSAILTADRLWKEIGSFILTGLEHPAVKKLIEISQLQTVLTIIPTISESIDYVFMEEIEKELGPDSDTDE